MENNDIKPTDASIIPMVERCLANFINEQGVQKISSLLSCIDVLKNYLIVNYGEEFTINIVNKNLGLIKLSKIKTYSDLERFIKKIRPKVNEVRMLYDSIKGTKQQKNKSVSSIRSLSIKVSPYQQELHYLLMILLKASTLQNRAISRELLRKPEESKSNYTSFERYRDDNKDGNN